MKTLIQTLYRGQLSGKTVDTIIKREYGRRSDWIPSNDRNSPYCGTIVRRDAFGTHVLDTIVSMHPAVKS